MTTARCMSTVVFLMLAFGCSLNPMYVDGDTREALALAQARLAKHGLQIDANPIHANRVHTHVVCFHLDEFRGLQWSSAFGLTSYPLSGFELTGANNDIETALRACPFQFRITVTAIDDRTQTQLIVSSDWWRLTRDSCEIANPTLGTSTCRMGFRSTAPPYDPRPYVYKLIASD